MLLLQGNFGFWGFILNATVLRANCQKRKGRHKQEKGACQVGFRAPARMEGVAEARSRSALRVSVVDEC